MGSITDKIEYLKETKRLLKELIIKNGGSVDDNTPFREYVTIIDGLLTNSKQLKNSNKK